MRLQEEIAALTNIQKNQGKELNRIMGNQEYDTKIKSLNEDIKKTRDKIKDLEKKLNSDVSDSQKLHNAASELKDRFARFREECKKGGSVSKLEQSCEKGDNKKEQVVVLQTSIATIQKMIKMERAGHKKRIEEFVKERANLLEHLKESEQEKKVGSMKVTEMKKSVRHNQLTPLCAPSANVTMARELGDAGNEQGLSKTMDDRGLISSV